MTRSRVEAHREVAERLWNAASQGDPEPLLELFDEEVEWFTHGKNPQAGRHRGLPAVLRHLAASADSVDELRSELYDILASDEGAVIRCRVHGRRGPKELDGTYFLWLRIVEGRVVEVAAVPWSQWENDTFWNLE